MVGVRLLVERGHLPVACRPVQADRLGQGVVGFQLDGADAVRRSVCLQLGQEPPAQAQPADRLGDPHPLDMGRRGVMELQDPASDRLAVQGGQQEQPRRRGHLLVGGGDAPGRVESLLEALRQLGEVGLHGATRLRAPRVAPADLDRRGDQEPLDLGHRRHQPVPLPRAERLEEGGGRVVRAPVELGLFGPPFAGQVRRPHPAVGIARLDDDQAVALQRPQQPAQVARIQVEPGPEPPDVTAVPADLPQQACLPERPVAGQERVIQRADPLRDGPVEPPDLLDHRLVHVLPAPSAAISLTLVRE
ncbi:MAG TPA: hypothetical protein VMA97_01180 [Streptosporangiaceae bacterium]|nr:hypothetical protein [Streptosporangiaceae bacterium]